MNLTREQWLTEISDLMLSEIFLSSGAEIRDDMKLKLSVGFPPGARSNSRRIACCFKSTVSAEGYNEIFISPVLDDSRQVLAALVHEICHAIDDLRDGHKGRFVSLARAAGLMSPYTQCIPNADLSARLDGYIELFGKIPHAHIDFASTPRQSNRNLLVKCNHCAFQFRTAKAQIDRCVNEVGAIICPLCTESMQFEIK